MRTFRRRYSNTWDSEQMFKIKLERISFCLPSSMRRTQSRVSDWSTIRIADRRTRTACVIVTLGKVLRRRANALQIFVRMCFCRVLSLMVHLLFNNLLSNVCHVDYIIKLHKFAFSLLVWKINLFHAWSFNCPFDFTSSISKLNLPFEEYGNFILAGKHTLFKFFHMTCS